MPRVPCPDEENHEQPDARDREATPEEGPDASGDEKLQQIARLITTARKFKRERYTDSSQFVKMCSRCWKPWGMHYGDGCCDWEDLHLNRPIFQYDEKLTELFNSIRTILGASYDDEE